MLMLWLIAPRCTIHHLLASVAQVSWFIARVHSSAIPCHQLHCGALHACAPSILTMTDKRAPVAVENVVNTDGVQPILISGGHLGFNRGWIMRDFQTIAGKPCLRVCVDQLLATFVGGDLRNNVAITNLQRSRAIQSKKEIVNMMQTVNRAQVGRIKTMGRNQSDAASDYIVLQYALTHHEEHIPPTVKVEIEVPMSSEVKRFLCKVEHRNNVATQLVIESASTLEDLIDLVAASAGATNRKRTKKADRMCFHEEYPLVKWDYKRGCPFIQWRDADGVMHQHSHKKPREESNRNELGEVACELYSFRDNVHNPLEDVDSNNDSA